MTDKFLDKSNSHILSSLRILLPGFAASEKADDVKDLAPYFDTRVSLSVVKAEFELLCKRVSIMNYDTEVLEVLVSCDANYFPIINYYLLPALAMLPITTASVERTFSWMKRIKNFLRNTMSNERLSAFAII